MIWQKFELYDCHLRLNGNTQTDGGERRDGGGRGRVHVGEEVRLLDSTPWSDVINFLPHRNNATLK